MTTNTLAPELLLRLDAYLHAANFLSVDRFIFMAIHC